MEFDWDEGNRDKNLRHGVHDREIEEALRDDGLVWIKREERGGEMRETVLARARTSGKYLKVVYTWRRRGEETMIRPISAVSMNAARTAPIPATATMTKRITIHSDDEIPSRFASEKEEREWWATHDFSAELMRRSWPDYNGLIPILFAPRTALVQHQIQWPLDIAEHHLRLARRGANPPEYADIRVQHASVAITMLAAAVEAGLNLTLAVPALGNPWDAARFVQASEKLVRSPISDRLDRAAEVSAELRDCDGLLETIRMLFRRRDELVHAFPGRIPAEHEEAWSVFRGPEPDDIAVADRFAEAARDFLSRLLLDSGVRIKRSKFPPGHEGSEP